MIDELPSCKCPVCGALAYVHCVGNIHVECLLFKNKLVLVDSLGWRLVTNDDDLHNVQSF